MRSARAALILPILLTATIAFAAAGEPSPTETVRDMLGAMISSTPVRQEIVERAYLSNDLRRFLGNRMAEQWRDFDADPILGAQDWSEWKLGNLVLHGNRVEAVFTVGKIRIERDFVLVNDGRDWRVDNVFYHDGGKITNLRDIFSSKSGSAVSAPSHGLGPSPSAAVLTARYPWTVKAQGDLTAKECAAAMLHDRNYWWSNGKCHMRFVRYAAGVAIRDTHALEDQSSVRRKGELLSPTQYRPDQDAYCEHGGYCYPASDIKLLGSIRTAPDKSDATGEEVDSYQGVTTSCEILADDRASVLAAGAQELFRDCH